MKQSAFLPKAKQTWTTNFQAYFALLCLCLAVDKQFQCHAKIGHNSADRVQLRPIEKVICAERLYRGILLVRYMRRELARADSDVQTIALS